MIKEIKIGKFEGLSVLMPDDFKEYAGVNNNELFYWTETCTQSLGYYPRSIHVPNVLDYEILGKSTELTESDLALILPGTFSKRRLSHFQDVIKAQGCYSVNPYGEEPKREDYNSMSDNLYANSIFKWKHDRWEKAQATTGTWIILRKLGV